jgi:hypothetical protein
VQQQQYPRKQSIGTTNDARLYIRCHRSGGEQDGEFYDVTCIVCDFRRRSAYNTFRLSIHVLVFVYGTSSFMHPLSGSPVYFGSVYP